MLMKGRSRIEYVHPEKLKLEVRNGPYPARSDHDCLRSASWTSCQIRCGVNGRWQGSTEKPCSALAMALPIAPPTAISPPSPAPLAPSGLFGLGLNPSEIERGARKSVAVGSR